MSRISPELLVFFLQRNPLITKSRFYYPFLSSVCAFFSSLFSFNNFPSPADKARDILSEKLSSWQDQCKDATDIPESVLAMIEGLRVPVSITPMPSPSPSRHSVVRSTENTLILELRTLLHILLRVSWKTCLVLVN